MGGDFFVYTYLEIKHSEGISYIELSYKQDWYCDCQEPDIDTDDEEQNYISRCDTYYENFLKPSYEPILIFDKGQFLKQNYIYKYFHFIQEKADGKLKYWRDTGVLLDIRKIERIRKIEIREKA